jgi:hypothetical protein
MRFFGRHVIFVCLLITVFCLISCEKKKEGKVIVTEQEFALRKDGTLSYSLDARGKVKNIGEVDVKKVVVTGYCRSCGEVILSGSWFVSDLEKTPDQKDIISYLTVGGEEAFSFQGIAFYYGQADDRPQSIPEDLEIVIQSFEIAN